MLHGDWSARAVTARLPDETSALRERHVREATRILKEERAHKPLRVPSEVRIGRRPTEETTPCRAQYFV